MENYNGTYYVKWRVVVNADSPEEAAQKALEIQRSEAGKIFLVTDEDSGDQYTIDLEDDEE